MGVPDLDSPLASLSITHVYYDPADPVSLLSAYLALVPQALVLVYVTVFATTREAEVLLMFAGQMTNELVNYGLKRLIKEERPKGPMTAGRGYGMPSSHAQFVAFWAVYLTMVLGWRYGKSVVLTRYHRSSTATATATGVNPSARSPTANHDSNGFTTIPRPSLTTSGLGTGGATTLAERVVAAVLAFGMAAAVAWSRVYLNYHTPKQVVVGCFAGTVFATGWFGMTELIRNNGLLEWGLDLPLARHVKVRDLLLVEDPAHPGWEKWNRFREAKKALKEA